MILEQGGITTEVTNPNDIALYKRRGWVEVKPVEKKQEEANPVDKQDDKAVKDAKSTKH